MQSGSEPTARDIDFAVLARRIKAWGVELGFAKVGITGVDLGEDEAHLHEWLRKGRHGSMDYMQHHGNKRSRPQELQPGTVRVVSVRMDYFPRGMDAGATWRTLGDGERAYIARYALGRDYHKLIRGRLQKLADRIAAEIGPFGYRAFTDSAPVLEKALARNAGLGWIGKHTLLLDRDAGSWFFLGELYTDLPLPMDEPATAHCGTCTRCMDVCPTRAITGPYQLDARRCIAYLTIESKDAIPEELRPLMGNRVFGCDDCQLVCPWNKFAQPTHEEDFAPRHGLDGTKLAELFAWTEEEFLKKTEGMPIRRAGYEGFSRNVAVALGNAPPSPEVIDALNARAHDPSPLVREHVAWALARHAHHG
ncbi:MAG: tRNA epoxyqueuosine(34) reductase QueG [Rhodanobacteraceae bacterium]|nr:MAG: tRNA epoxyqueuosine(34) reductase QueG [Rhodanobacteraceae bacterium]